MCKRRDNSLGRLPDKELLRRFVKVMDRAAEDIRNRDQARGQGRDNEADVFCAQAEHRRAWGTSYKKEIDRRKGGNSL